MRRLLDSCKTYHVSPRLQLRGIDKKIAALKAELTYASNGDKKQFLSGLSSLEGEKSRLANGLLGDLSSGNSSNNSASQDEDDAADKETPPPTPLSSFARAPKSPTADNDSDAEEEDDDEEGGSPGGDGAHATPGANIVITEKELRQNFHLPLHTAARKFGICTTAFKKLCRRFGIAKWPHRQLRGIDKKIAALKAELNYTTGDKNSCWKSLQALEEEKARLLCSGLPTGAESQKKKRPRSIYEEETPRQQPHGAKSSRAKRQQQSSPEPSDDDEAEQERGEDREEDDHEEESGKDREGEEVHVGSSSALDLLAAVCGGFALEGSKSAQEEESKVQCALAAAPWAAALDTPPTQPASPVMMSLKPVSGIYSVLSSHDEGVKKESPMMPSSSTHLVGFSWNGQLDQCA